MDGDARVCPFCGEEPGPGVFCAACGRNLSQVEQLPTRRAWELERAPDDAPPPAAAADTVARFVAAMHAAGDPGTTRLPLAEPGFLGRTRHAEGWVVAQAGLFVTVDGRLHRLDSATRGLGQRAEAVHLDTVGPEAGESADAARLATALEDVLRAHGVEA
jgi:hypothetical protein